MQNVAIIASGVSKIPLEASKFKVGNVTLTTPSPHFFQARFFPCCLLSTG